MEHRHLPDLRVDFLLRNAAALRSSISFDRILVGGDCSEDLLLDMFYRLNPGGIMVAPCQGNLLRIYKVWPCLASPNHLLCLDILTDL